MQSASAHDYEAASSLEEGVPLLPKGSELRKKEEELPQDAPVGSEPLPPSSPRTPREQLDAAASAVARYASAATQSSPVFGTSHHDKLLIYDHDTLLSSKCVIHVGRSVFGQKPVLHTLVGCSFLAGSAAFAVFFMPKASKLDTQKFQDFGNFLKVFIVFMLGIYTQQAFKRWWMTVTTYENILIGIRQLSFMLHTINATPASRKLIESYCIASGYIMNVEVRNAQILDKKQHASVQHVCAWLVLQGMLTVEESAQIAKTPSHNLSSTRTIWSWIGELVAHPEVEEGITVLPPLLVRTIMMCQACISEIESLKTNITMQTPFMYASLLAILVHVNNIILSISCGMALGSSMSEIHRRAEQLSGERDSHHGSNALMGQFYEAIQTLGVQLMIVLLAPMIYVGFLHIAHILCYPFGDESHHLPTETLMARLHSELNAMNDSRSYFRQKHKDRQHLCQKLQAKAEPTGKHEAACDGGDDGGDA